MIVFDCSDPIGRRRQSDIAKAMYKRALGKFSQVNDRFVLETSFPIYQNDCMLNRLSEGIAYPSDNTLL